MKHKYSTGKNLFGSYFVAFEINSQGDKYRHFETFENQCDRFKALRTLVLFKRRIVEAIDELAKAKAELTKAQQKIRRIENDNNKS